MENLNRSTHSMKVTRLFAMAAACLLAASLSAQVVINEIHYDPPFKTELAEFIELYNSGAADVDLSGWTLANAVGFTFPPSTTLRAGAYMVVAENPTAFARKFSGKTALGPWTGLLANDGESIELRDSANRLVDSVSYKLGFPWPTVGELPGYSIELIDPALDNDLGGSWRRALKGDVASAATTLIAAGTQWKYRKGTAEASSPTSAWRAVNFDDSQWLTGATPIGYESGITIATRLADMRGGYTSVFLRKKFNVADPSLIAALRLEALYDDGFKAWINGRSVINANLPAREVAYNETTAGSITETFNYDPFQIASPASILVAGENVLTIQLHNVSLADSSDCYFDARLVAELGSASAGPTPGARNAAFSTNAPPAIRQVEHTPEQPKPGEEVRISAKITDPNGVANVVFYYQIVEPGSYIELNDAAYETSWATLPMKDEGTAGDLRAGDDIYTVVLPGSFQIHRRLVRYRIVAVDSRGVSVRAPYLDDPQPNFAYFVSNGIPEWQGSARPGVAPVETFSREEMGRLPAYQLIAKRVSVEDATWNSRYTGDLYRWWGTLVYDGKVYDHIRYRARGGVWRYAMGKNMWKFDFNRGHDFQARDNFGEKYATQWRKLNLGANIQQGNFNHRGEQGMFESVGFRLFNLSGVEAPKTHWATFRVVDDAAEAPANQFGGDFWGLYLGIEQEDGRFLDEHDLPDGNLYKMENYSGDLNNQGRYAATDKSDINSFTSVFRNSTPAEEWWRQNFDLEKYYSYQAIVQGIHHYDICYGKNYFYYLNPDTGKWSVHTWDLDLTWADNMYDEKCGAVDEFKNRVTTRAPFSTEYKNRVRELRDLLFNTDQAWKVIDEHALIVKGTNTGPTILAADRAMWDYNPVMANGSIVDLSKAGQGLFYRFPIESASNRELSGSFDAVIQIMKNYVVKRGAVLDSLAADPAIPGKPVISYDGPSSFPLNRLVFRTSAYNGTAPFAGMEWRVGEVRDPAAGRPAIYEIEPVWETGEITTFSSTVTVPADLLKVGHTYRARVRMKDSSGRWSNWSAPLEFPAGEPDNASALTQYLRITELMYNPPKGSDYEYVELQNTSGSATLQLAGVTFTEGIDYTFPEGASLAPGEYALVIRGAAQSIRSEYALNDSVKLFGPYSGALNNDGETITLKTAAAGAVITSFTFNDRSGWPIASDGTGHSLVATATESLNFGGSWRASAGIGGSPGGADPAAIASVVINEVAAHTDYSDPEHPEYDSNDWIELFNIGSDTSLGDYYLTDDPGNLAKWQLPNVTLRANDRISFDEVSGFHKPITSGFGLNKAGEELYLSYLPDAGARRVVDAIRFKGQENGVTFGRFPDGAPFFYRTEPTRSLANKLATQSFAISEIMFHPGSSNAVEESWQEYVELWNASTAAAVFSNTNGVFRIDGGISFTFATNTVVPARGTVLLVSFDPFNLVEATRFKSYYGIQNSNVTLIGPFSGRLANSSDRVAIEKPEAPDLPGEPVAWVILDEVIYTDASGGDRNGDSLTRIDLALSGNDRANFAGRSPTPGWIAANSAPVSVSARRTGTGIALVFEAQPGAVYRIESRTVIDDGAWTPLQEIRNATGRIEVQDQPGTASRFYRVVSE